MTAHLRITQAGPLVSVQDTGRAGLSRYGVTASGPIDRLAYHAANAALGNPTGAPAIEVSLGGVRLDCVNGSLSLAVAGGGFIVQADQTYGSWQVLTLHAGQSLTIRRGPWGSWCYLAFAGRLICPDWLGSHATHASSGKGGGLLRAGDDLRIEDTSADHLNRAIPCPIFARPRHRLHVILGPQDRFFAPETLQAFLTTRFALTTAYDRMGVRLSGVPLAPNAALTMPSEPVSRGAVQVSGDGIATLLLADHQTTGGYPKIATVLDCDLDAACQLRSFDGLGFTALTPAQAIARARLHSAAQARYLTSLRPA
ncbi:MAG: biotin-dependent carboxyltransferase family protein [Cypionkella sp.]